MNSDETLSFWDFFLAQCEQAKFRRKQPSHVKPIDRVIAYWGFSFGRSALKFLYNDKGPLEDRCAIFFTSL